MIDPILGLTFNLQSNPGTYAILIGPGVSRTAAIPTGWEVTLDLIRKLASMSGDNCDADPSSWYAAKFHKDADYAELLREIAPTSAAQQELLRSYFEPTEGDREAGRKLPTKAHRAIAELVKLGLVRVILTTNFDRLMESALEAQGIAPTVISSADMAIGATPLTHAKCTVIKLHGDYLDSRCKNSPDALAKYDPEMDKLVDRVLDEYGLIICGWSAEYDTALRVAFSRAPSRRYPAYWAHVGNPGSAAKSLISLRAATTVSIQGADEFFVEIAEKSKSLAEFSRPHPLSKTMALETLKKYLSKDEHRIQLWDFLVGEATKAANSLQKAWGLLGATKPTPELVGAHLKRIESEMEVLISLFSTASYFGRDSHIPGVIEANRKIWSDTRDLGLHFETWTRSSSYPSILLIYATGLSAVLSDNYSTLATLARQPGGIRHGETREGRLARDLNIHDFMDRSRANGFLFAGAKRKTPISDYLFGVLREDTLRFAGGEWEYAAAFDRFEYLWALINVDVETEDPTQGWYPYGRYVWHAYEYSHGRAPTVPSKVLRERLAAEGDEMPELKAGLFRGKASRLLTLLDSADAFHTRLSKEFW